MVRADSNRIDRPAAMTALLFAAVVLAWGFTWYAIKLQLGVVAPEVSILWRFALAAAVMWAGLAATGRLRRGRWRDHRWFAALGACLFCFNFIFIYKSTGYMASGIVSVVFTTATLFNALNQWLFLGRRPRPQVVGGAVCGIAGIALLFSADLAGLGAPGAAVGLLFGLAGTYVFSLGNLASMKAGGLGLDLPNITARGMSWGVLFLALWSALRGHAFVIEPTPAYLGSLVYLSVVGSVAGFLAYLALVRRAGADRAAYATVAFPVVALTVSTVLEGYHWSPLAVLGLPAILLGNVLVFAPPLGRRKPA